MNDHEFEARLDAVLSHIRNLLVQKRQAYGDSAISVFKCLSGATAEERLCVSIDHKLARIANIRERGVVDDEDAVQDLVGYLVLLMILRLK